MIRFPEGLSKQHFLKQFWQKSAVVLQSSLVDYEQLISKQQLLDLSLIDEVESRLILENGPEKAWQTYHGPQNTTQLAKLAGQTNWTLLIQSVNLWHQPTAKLLESFDFLPHWRLDDIMISYSSASGTVGAHLDQYDVFLIQLSGSRRWQVGKINAEVQLKDNAAELQQIEPFDTLIDEVLTAGDILYVPPNTAHNGVTIEPGMTLSVGFRSPALSEMFMIVGEQLMLDKKQSHYRDCALNPEQDNNQISSASMTKAVNWFNNVEQHDTLIRKSFGILQSQPKQELLYEFPESSVEQLVTEDFSLYRDPASRLAWYQVNSNLIWLFINGECYDLTALEIEWVKELSNKLCLKKADVSGYLNNHNFLPVLKIFVDSGLFGLK